VSAGTCTIGHCYSHLSATLRHAIHFVRTLRSPSPRERKHQETYTVLFTLEVIKGNPNNKTEIPIRTRAVQLHASSSAFVSEFAPIQKQPIPILGLVTRPSSEQIFWIIKQRVLVIPYRRFGTTYRAHLQDKNVLDS
jgi:hypothetical protein